MYVLGEVSLSHCRFIVGAKQNLVIIPSGANENISDQSPSRSFIHNSAIPGMTIVPIRVTSGVVLSSPTKSWSLYRSFQTYSLDPCSKSDNELLCRLGAALALIYGLLNLLQTMSNHEWLRQTLILAAL